VEAVIEEQRQPLEWSQFQVAQNRSQPGLFVVDELLNVVFFREDPHERRTACRVEVATRSLPLALRRRLSELTSRPAMRFRACGQFLMHRWSCVRSYSMRSAEPPH